MGSRITQLANNTHQYDLSLHGLLGHRLMNSQPRVLLQAAMTNASQELELKKGRPIGVSQAMKSKVGL